VERTGEVMAEIEKRSLRCARRTSANGGVRPDVFVLDTTGELKNFYACADVIFMGKSLTQHGGQNIIEPALYGKPVIVGPHMENFSAVVQDFLAADALVQVHDAAGLTAAAEQLLGHPARRAELGRRAAQVVREKAGALSRTLDMILNVRRAG
jgi:3-deoxy-D-manno-octulosonic-acid transferase